MIARWYGPLLTNRHIRRDLAEVLPGHPEGLLPGSGPQPSVVHPAGPGRLGRRGPHDAARDRPAPGRAAAERAVRGDLLDA
ncbi:hypothetical protein LT493_44320 [Streptomyces tricolor]|nr:hypothetical protein [Streptomyces tricolor]